jgi:cyclopropane fatty-acyl-phospholipid synthase-like methyltransferase
MRMARDNRLRDIVDALPLRDGIRILEIGCGPGAMARDMANRIENGFVLAIDRSQKAIDQAIAGSQAEISTGKLAFRKADAHHFALEPDEEPFDLAVAIRVGALDGRHPELEAASHRCIAAALKPGCKLYIDGGDPIREVPLTWN